MSLLAKLQDDMKLALKSREALRLSTLRLVLSSVSYARIEKRGELTDDEVLGVLTREAKKRRESVEAAVSAGRTDIAEAEGSELNIINEYLPKQLDEAEVEALVKSIIAEVGAVDIKDRGKVMGPLMAQTRGRADGKLASAIVERLLRG